jgi:ribosomal-protein-alanine N-acetyltransferase
MSEHDLLEVVEIEEQSGLSRWGWAAYYAELQGGNRDLMLIARASCAAIIESSPIAGYIVARETAGELHINNVAVRAEYRRRGIGAALLGRVLHEARRRKVNAAFLEVRSANFAAQALYEKSGFRAIARRADYYSEPREDAVVMSLVLG